jgi:uncharacterized membrane protein YbhN (UPF0104 family)
MAFVSVWHVVLLFMLTVMRNMLGALRSRIVVAVRRPVPFVELVRQHFVASFFNNFLPTAIGGDGVRVIMLRRFAIPATDGALLVAVERVVGFYALLLIACSSSLFWASPVQLRMPIYVATAGYTAVLAWLFLAFRPPVLGLRFLRRVRDVLALFHRRMRLLWAILALSLAYQGISVFISYYVATVALGSVPVLPFLTLVPLVWFFTMIPISLGGVGLRELAFIELLAVIGISPEDALFVSLGTYLALVMSGAVGGVMQLVWPRDHGGSDENEGG